MGKHNPGVQLRLGSTQLGCISAEKELEVLVGNSLMQHIVHSQQPHRMLGCTNKGITNRRKEVTVPLYSVLIRPPLKYCVWFWSLLYTKDVDKLEKAQRRGTKMINGMGSLSYEEKAERSGFSQC